MSWVFHRGVAEVSVLLGQEVPKGCWPLKMKALRNVWSRLPRDTGSYAVTFWAAKLAALGLHLSTIFVFGVLDL